MQGWSYTILIILHVQLHKKVQTAGITVHGFRRAKIASQTRGKGNRSRPRWEQGRRWRPGGGVADGLVQEFKDTAVLLAGRWQWPTREWLKKFHIFRGDYLVCQK